MTGPGGAGGVVPPQPPQPMPMPMPMGFPQQAPGSGYGTGPGPGPGYGPGYGVNVGGPVSIAVLQDGRPLPPNTRVDLVPGSPFGVALLKAPSTVSGPAIGSMVGGIVSVLVSFVTGCLGLAQGAAIGGAFAILATAFGAGAIVFGTGALRQVRRGSGRVTGKGMAVAGLTCGGTGIVLSALAILGAFVLASGG